MTGLRGLAILLVLQALGEALTHTLGLPIPGPVLGLMLLLAALQLAWVRTPVAAAAELLLAHLSLLFIPVGVGVITHLDLIAQYGLRLAVIILLSIEERRSAERPVGHQRVRRHRPHFLPAGAFAQALGVATGHGVEHRHRLAFGARRNIQRRHQPLRDAAAARLAVHHLIAHAHRRQAHTSSGISTEANTACMPRAMPA